MGTTTSNQVAVAGDARDNDLMPFDLDAYIDTHLRYELKYLLVDATTWTAVHDENDRAPHPPHLVVMSMDSAFLHTRVLYEFLTHDEGWGKKTPHARKQSQLWKDYSTAMHIKVLHPGANRPYVPTNTIADGLKDRVLDFALDIVNLWVEVADDPAMKPYRATMLDAREFALADAEHSAAWFKIPCPFT